MVLLVVIAGACGPTTPDFPSADEVSFARTLQTAEARGTAVARGTVFPEPTRRVRISSTSGPSPTPWLSPTPGPRLLRPTPIVAAPRPVFTATPTRVPRPTATPTQIPRPTAVPTAPPTSTVVPRPTPASESSKLRFTSDLDTRFYSVFGTETSAIFDSVEANGPTLGTELEGHFTSGLTEYEGHIDYLMKAIAGFCWLNSGSVDLTFVVTLPRHEQLDQLSFDLKTRWNQFQLGVTEHEQRHVDIFFETMRSTRENIEDLSGRFSGCERLNTSIAEIWDQAFVTDQALQAEFHGEVAELSRKLREPVEMAIALNETQTDLLNEQIIIWGRDSDRLRTEIDALDEAMRPYQERMDEIAAEYPDNGLPAGPYEEYEDLRSERNTLNQERNSLVVELNAFVLARNAAVEEFNSINAETNDLIEELNWLP